VIRREAVPSRAMHVIVFWCAENVCNRVLVPRMSHIFTVLPPAGNQQLDIEGQRARDIIKLLGHQILLGLKL